MKNSFQKNKWHKGINIENGIFRKYLVYSFILIFLYYVLPLIAFQSLMVILLLAIYPIVNFLLAMLLYKKDDINILLPIISIILFIPTIWIYYNESAIIYIAIYLVSNLLGIFIGKSINKAES